MHGMSRRNLLKYSKRAGAIVIIIVLVLIIRSLAFSIISTHDRAQILKSLQSELSQKKQEQAYLAQKLYIVKTDSFVEEEARRKLGLVKEGEKVVVDEKIQPKKPEVLKEEVPNWKKWQSLFF